MTAAVLIRIIVVALFALISFVAYRWLIPRLWPSAKILASLFLAAQVIVIIVALFIQPASSYQARLWHLDREWNIPSTLASTQLALGAGVALTAAWIAKEQPSWKRFYLLGIGLVFLYLAQDEYFEAHEFTEGWANSFVLLGGIVVAATLLAALRSPKRSWIWHLSFLAGLAMSAGGGLLVETQCGHQIFLAIGRCAQHYMVEEPLEFLGFWLALVALFGHLACLVARPSRLVRRWLFVIPALWLLLISLPEAHYHVERYTARAKPAAVAYESGMHLRGYFLEDSRTIHLLLSPGRLDFLGLGIFELGYSIHLIDQVSGESAHNRDEHAHRRHLLLGPGAAITYRQEIDLRLPQQLPVNRAYWIVLTLWREADGAFAKEKIVASDHQLLSESQVVLGELVAPAAEATASHRVPRALFDNGFILELVDLPEAARAGESLSIGFAWRSEDDGSEDHAQFLHLGHMESGEWMVVDRPPLGPRLPTRLWYDGLAESETWHVPLPADLPPGRYAVFSGLYRASDKERVPAKSADGDYFLDARVPLGSLVIE